MGKGRVTPSKLSKTLAKQSQFRRKKSQESNPTLSEARKKLPWYKLPVKAIRHVWEQFYEQKKSSPSEPVLHVPEPAPNIPKSIHDPTLIQPLDYPSSHHNVIEAANEAYKRCREVDTGIPEKQLKDLCIFIEENKKQHLSQAKNHQKDVYIHHRGIILTFTRCGNVRIHLPEKEEVNG